MNSCINNLNNRTNVNARNGKKLLLLQLLNPYFYRNEARFLIGMIITGEKFC